MQQLKLQNLYYITQIALNQYKSRTKMSKKYFINNLNTSFGTALLAELVKQPTQDPVHMCTMKDNFNVKPNGIKKILKRQKPKLFAKKATQDCEVYVYNVSQTDTQDIQFGLQMMKKPFEDNKTFILVSDIMVWSNSQRKIKKDPLPTVNQQNGQGNTQKNQDNQNPSQGDESDEGKSQKPSEEQSQQEQNQILEKKQIEYTFWEDIDYRSRVCHHQYEWIKEIQDKILAFKRQNVKMFIVCPGIIYGCGEDTFYPLFKAAWLQQPTKLPYLGQGDNLVPTIHLKDLVKFVVKLAQSPPEESNPYFLAFDLTADKTQKSLISTISQGIGLADVVSVDESPLLEDQEKFKLNLDIRPSKYFVGTVEEPVEFEWTSKNGMKQTIKSLLKDFCEKQFLRPMKVIIYQRERDWTKQSKIDFILEAFSKYYRVPILTLTKILEYAKQYSQGELSEDLNDQWENIMTYLKEGKQRPGLDQTMKVFYRVIRWRLLRNDCTNRGYILHNYPIFRTELQNIFNKISIKKFKRKVPKKKKQKPIQLNKKQEKIDQIDNNDNDDDNDQKDQKVQNPPLPQPVDVAPEQPQPAQEEPQEQAEESQGPKFQSYYPETLISIKRMGTQLQQMQPLIQYFISNGIQELVYDTTGKNQTKIFQSLRSQIERNGRPNNYLVEESQLISTYQQFIQKENISSLSKRQQKQQQQIQAKLDVQTRRKNLARDIIEMVENEGQEEIKKMPFRNYLMEFVVPTLNQGLLEVSNIIPNDPVDLLAQYLYQKSYDV